MHRAIRSPIPTAVIYIELGPAGNAPTVRAEPITFAVLGDYGTGDENGAHVAGMVEGWSPNFPISPTPWGAT